MDRMIHYVELAWSHTGGVFPSAGRPHLFAWARAIFLSHPARYSGSVGVVARAGSAGQWMEHSRPFGRDDAQRLATGLLSLSSLEAPVVEGVVDSSDLWTALAVEARIDDRTSRFTIHAHVSGLIGADAAALQAVFRQVFTVSGYTEYDTTLYGRP